MKLPPNVRFEEEVRLLIWRPVGVVNEAAVNKIIAVLGDLETSSGKPFNRFSDTSAADAIDLNFKFIFHVSLFRRLSYRGPPIKSAILATTETHLHYSKLHALLTQGSPIKVRVFQDRTDAAKWLGVPIELLAAEPSGEKHSE
jgi:hypothetical protein